MYISLAILVLTCALIIFAVLVKPSIKIGKYEVANNPRTKEDFMTLFKYMGEEGVLELKIPYFWSFFTNYFFACL